MNVYPIIEMILSKKFFRKMLQKIFILQDPGWQHHLHHVMKIRKLITLQNPDTNHLHFKNKKWKVGLILNIYHYYIDNYFFNNYFLTLLITIYTSVSNVIIYIQVLQTNQILNTLAFPYCNT